ncbi:hypothetical protein BC941DRAFT_449805 [Chlamydoabsidia padenii]|nr:hypothetical protein BC941DRAFT_449805 [Chlamydoabsidia padenii]
MDRQKQIVNTLETYFSDANLRWDKVMQQYLHERNDGCKIIGTYPSTLFHSIGIPFEKLIGLKKMKLLQVTAEDLKEAVHGPSKAKLKVSEDGTSIGLINPFTLNKIVDRNLVKRRRTEERDDWSIYVEGLGKKHGTEQVIVDLFEKHVGPVVFVRFPADRNGNTGFHGYCFVEFENKDDVDKAVDIMNDKEIAKLRVMTKDEYLLHQQKCAEQIKQLWTKYNEQPEPPTQDEDYPKNVIAFVQNTHIKSAKTTIKTLLEQSGASITFMKHKKGIDSCHVRLSSAEDTNKLVDYFEKHALTQSSGTDTTGSITKNPNEAIKVRALSGYAEEMYWMTDKNLI